MPEHKMPWDGKYKRSSDKADSIIWWLMITFMAIILGGGGAWATSVNAKMEDVISLKNEVIRVREELRDIKEIMQAYIKRDIENRRF